MTSAVIYYSTHTHTGKCNLFVKEYLKLCSEGGRESIFLWIISQVSNSKLLNLTTPNSLVFYLYIFYYKTQVYKEKFSILISIVTGIFDNTHWFAFDCHGQTNLPGNYEAFTKETRHSVCSFEKKYKTHSAGLAHVLWGRQWRTEVRNTSLGNTGGFREHREFGENRTDLNVTLYFKSGFCTVRRKIWSLSPAVLLTRWVGSGNYDGVIDPDDGH